MRRTVIIQAICVVSTAWLPVQSARAQQRLPAPPSAGSDNIDVVAHIPLGRAFSTTDVEIEQELSRPYAYVSRSLVHGFDIIDLEQPEHAKVVYSWRIENAELHQGLGGMDGKYFKLDGRYYYVQSLQFEQGGPDAGLGAVVFDVTGLPDASRVREVARIHAPDTPGGFHNLFAYKHSDGRVLLFATTVGNQANVYDMETVLAGGAEQGPLARIPVPENPVAGGGSSETWHDFYIAFDPLTQQDKFYGAAQPVGAYVIDVTNPQEPEVITAVAGVPGVTRDHTFVASPDGRLAVAESHLRYSPIRIYDLQPGLGGESRYISRPIGAWTANWKTHAHNMEMRWPFVFVANYEEGLQVFDMSRPERPHTVGFFRTFEGPYERGFGTPSDPEGGPTSFFTEVANGAFGLDVRNADGLIVLSDFSTGFWAFRMEGFNGWDGQGWGTFNISSVQDWDRGPIGVTPATD